MVDITKEEFEKLVSEQLDLQPNKYMEKLNNVVFVVEDEPTEEQRKKLNLCAGQTLFGLYEGIPQTRRTSYLMALPDKITVFRKPMLRSVDSKDQLEKQIHSTLWHEIAHHFGLEHEQIHKLQNE